MVAEDIITLKIETRIGMLKFTRDLANQCLTDKNKFYGNNFASSKTRTNNSTWS